jgi:lysophospholipid acyltransferase (LPLAT)-like uncharacterized protein
MLRALLRKPGIQALLGRAVAQYLRLVRTTSTITYLPANLYEGVDPLLPGIVAFWHGEHFLAPFLRRPQDRVKVLVSLHRDGEINAVAAEAFGVGTIRGSGSHGAQNLDKRGAAALIEMIRALEDGVTIAMTADVPKVSRVAGLGIIALARRSGRPIIPAAIVTSRRRTVEKAWDKSKIPLPFGRVVIAAGTPLWVPADADAETMERLRAELEREIERTTRQAYATADGGA